ASATAGSDGVFARGIHCLDNQASSCTNASESGGGSRRQNRCARFPRRFQHRCLLLMGTHCRRARSRARLGALLCSQLPVVDACGNTSLPNPSTMRIGLKPDGRIALHQGAIDIGQGSATVVTQICADALGCPIDRFDLISGDTSITPDCGKTSASRQTFVTGKAAYMAGQELRRKILRMADACECAKISFENGRVGVQDGERRRSFTLADLPLDAHGYALTA